MSHSTAEYIMMSLIYWLFLLDSMILISTTEYNMIVTWGAPLAYTEPTKLQISWEDCLQLCLNSDNCVLIHDIPPICEYFRYGQVSTVQKLYGGSRVAFRLPSVSQTCMGPESEPILIGDTVQSDFESGKIYNITFQNEVWSFQRTGECDPPAVKFLRGSVEVCMQIVQTSECISRHDAASLCGNLGISNSLMGVASSEEMTYIKSMSSTLLNKQKTSIRYRRIGIWIDGLRKDTCQPPAQKGPSCNGYNEFDYFDPTAPNPAFPWRYEQPDGLFPGRPAADCLFMRFASDEAVGVGDLPCTESISVSQEICYAGYLCGRYAT